MKFKLLNAGLLALLSPFTFAGIDNNNADNTQITDVSGLQAEITQLKQDYDQRLQTLEAQVQNSAGSEAAAPASANAFNPQISVILDGQLSSFNNKPDAYQLPGFALGEEAGLAAEGFSLGESELSASSNVDDKFYGKLTLALAEFNGATDIAVEEAFFETLALGNGVTIRGGRFFSGVGYLNQQHGHAWDFADTPLVYSGLWGGQYKDDGLQISWIAPVDIYLQFGAEAFAGGDFPAGGEHSSNAGSQVIFANTGGDINESNSWQAGLSYYAADVKNREASVAGLLDAPTFTGNSHVAGASFIYKWAPDGNTKNRNFKLQMEFFQRNEDGTVDITGLLPPETTDFKGTQRGYYAQGIYQFMPQWQTGLRYDVLDSDNSGDNAAAIIDAGLYSNGIKPKRYSVMLAWLPSEFSRLRLQYNRDASYTDHDNQIILQYTMSLGAHGAHSY